MSPRFWPMKKCTSKCKKWRSSSPTTATLLQTRWRLSRSSTKSLPVVMDPFEALKPDAPVLREDLAGKDGPAPTASGSTTTTSSHGKRATKAAADAAFDAAPVKVSQHMYYPRVHPCPLETCGCVANFDPIRGELTTHITSQAPHVVRTVVSMLVWHTRIKSTDR